MTDRQPTPGIHENFASNLMERAEPCPVCDKLFRPDDLCATDIELGICHAACLEGSPTVDLDTGEPTDGEIGTFRYSETSNAPAYDLREAAEVALGAFKALGAEDGPGAQALRFALVATPEPSPDAPATGYPIEDEHIRYWRVWWQGSGPQRGDHIMLASGYDLGYAREIAYLGDQHHEAARALVELHNFAVDKLRASLAATPAPQSHLRTVVELPMTAFADRPPQRDELNGEQTILTYNSNAAIWDLAFFESGEEFPDRWLGDTHWIDISGMWPGVIAQVASFAITEGSAE